ncbi:MAG TPA: hypothetical protein VFZ21_11170 [Gemmatimonadaceae bacterium]|jgi:hypothetical protein|nr:hypothetical protein [Gemmatimonadaceae bacterium]
MTTRRSVVAFLGLALIIGGCRGAESDESASRDATSGGEKTASV